MAKDSKDVLDFIKLREKEEKKLGRKLTDFETSFLSEQVMGDIYNSVPLTKEESDLEIEGWKD